MVKELKLPTFDVARLGNDSVIPCSYEAEDYLLPGTKEIVNTIKELLK